MELIYLLLLIIALITNAIIIKKFFDIASNISKIKDYISGAMTFNQCVNRAELEIVKGNKEKALELLKIALYLNTNVHFGEESVSRAKFDELLKRANEL